VRIDYVNQQEPPYYVMEALEGETLACLVKPMPPARVRTLMVPILEALIYLHERSIIHRDLKPANIMLLPDGQIKLMDFGLVLLTDDDRTRLTASGTILGTPAYMAPEQISGSTVDHRADLYAIGLIAYEMLAGEIPWPMDVVQLLSAKLSQDLPPLEKACPDLSAEWTTWVHTLLQRDPEKRFRNAEEALQQLPA
jgi:serine/threonine-protein kinase